MAGILDDVEFEIVCEKCGRKTKKSIGWVKRNRYFVCPCGARMLNDTVGVRRQFGELDRAGKALEDQIKKFNK